MFPVLLAHINSVYTNAGAPNVAGVLSAIGVSSVGSAPSVAGVPSVYSGACVSSAGTDPWGVMGVKRPPLPESYWESLKSGVVA